MRITTTLVTMSLCALVLPVAARAQQPTLIAIGTLDANRGDLSTETAAPLENGTPGNLLGGLGSGLAHAGGDTFLAVPDRGPNATAYNTCVDNTTSYINRFQTLRLALVPSSAGSLLPFTLTPELLDTTLLSSPSPLVYAAGGSYGIGCGVLPSGDPALNATNHRNYLVGRSDNFATNRLSTYPQDARFDPEGIRVANNGMSVFISDEYGPYVYQFNRLTGKRINVFTLPDAFAVSTLSPIGDTEITVNTSGRVANKGMEGLAITPDGTTLVGVMQSPLIQDGGTSGPTTRIVTIDIESGEMHQYAYTFDNIGTATKPKFGTISEILAVNNHVFLLDERDGKGFGDDSAAVQKKIYMVDLATATEVLSSTPPAMLAANAVAKTLFLDVVTALTTAPTPIPAKEIPAKLEGIAFGDDVVIEGVVKHTLFIANDNDFLPVVVDTNHPSGAANPNRFFVFAFDDAAVNHEFVPQSVQPR